jgi:hypothetical protein
MGFTNVAWESRSTEQLARDLTDGPGPSSVGGAGASWIRVANEFANISVDFDRLLERFRSTNASAGSDAALRKLEEFGRWLQGVSASAAANGQRAEEAAVANTVAVLAMPTVPEAIEAKAAHDMMASLAAYNGAVLTGRFAEFDQAATVDQANAAAVMQQYEEACAALGTPWQQMPPPEIAKGDALAAESGASTGGGSAAGGLSSGGSAALPPMPLAPFAPTGPKAGEESRSVRGVHATAGASGAAMGGAPYAPMGAMGRGDAGTRDYESDRPAETLAGAGDTSTGLSDGGPNWLPAAQQSNAPYFVSNVSWGPDSSAFEQFSTVGPTDQPSYADNTSATPEHGGDGWVSPVIGVDKELTL